MVRRIGKQAPLMAAVAMALFSAGSVWAQSRPAQPPPRLLDDGQPRGGEVLRDRDRERMMPPGLPDNPNSDFPTGEVHDAVDANARAAFARATYHRLQWALDDSIRQMQYGFDHSHEAQDAKKAEAQAWADYVAARNGALRSVVNDPKYKANAQLKAELGEQIGEVRATWDASKPKDKVARADYDKAEMKAVVGLATVKLDYAQVVTDMEVSALRGDAKVADARSRLMSAGARVQAMRDNFDMTVRTSSELAGLRRQIEEARVASIASEAYRNGAVEAANVSLDYAYWKNRYNFTNYECGF